MSLPKYLTESLRELQSSEIVAGVVTTQTINSFVDVLNNSIPSPSHPALYSLYKFNRTKYLYDRERFVSDIAGLGPYEAMILWTDFKDILSYFGLTEKMFLGWDKRTNRYRGSVLKTPPAQPIQILRRDDVVLTSEVVAHQATDVPAEVKVAEAMDDDMVRVYDLMQRRMREYLQQ
jgi:hypothetical protein